MFIGFVQTKDKNRPALTFFRWQIGDTMAQKPLLILINPYSGTKLAKRLFKTYVQPELNQRHLPYEVLETEYAGK